VFQDTRFQSYPWAHFDAILRASESQTAWDELMRRHGLDWAVLSRPRPNALSGAGRFPPAGWATVFWDDAFEVLVRRAGAYADLVARREYRLLRPGVDPYVVASGLLGPNGERILDEARRQRDDNPRGYAGAVVLCQSGDRQACALITVKR
jgi:hypothetical protein